MTAVLVTGFVMEKMRNTASGLMARRCSTSIEPTDATYASLPCRATTARRPGSLPESTYT